MTDAISDMLTRDEYKSSRPHPIGRPPILTELIIEQICDFLVEGFSIARSARLAGISESTIHRWLAKGKLSEAEPIYKMLVERVREVVECSELELLQSLRIAGQDSKNWRSNAWMLERRFPEKYGKQPQPTSESTGENKKPDMPPNLAVVN